MLGLELDLIITYLLPIKYKIQTWILRTGALVRVVTVCLYKSARFVPIYNYKVLLADSS